MASPTIRQIWIALAIPVALAAALLLNRLVVSDKTRVAKVIGSMAEEAGRADVNAIFSHVSEDYEDDVQGREELRATVEKLFSTYGPLQVTTGRMTVNMSGRLASVEVMLSAHGNGRNHHETGGTSVWQIQLRKDSDEVWRVTRTTPVQMRGTDIGGWRDVMRWFMRF